MSAFTIRILTAEDVHAFQKTRIEAVEAHPEAFLVDGEEERGRPLDLVASRLEPTDDTCVLAAIASDEVVGMVGLVRETRPKVRHKSFILGMYVNDSFRGQGIGRKLLEGALERAKAMPGLSQVSLSVMTTNTEALKLYESMGFKTWGIEPKALLAKGRLLDEAHMVYLLE